MKIEQSKNPKLLTNGFVKTSGSDGTLSVDTNTYATGSGTATNTNTGDQTITNSSDATSHTVTLSATGGSVQLIEGTNITLTTGGTGSAGTVTIAASGGSGATTALDNLASVAINTTLVSDTDNTDDLGTTLKKWANLFVTTIGATATRVTKGWFTDLEVTNAIAGSITGNAATVTTNANLTGDVTSVGNATTLTNAPVIAKVLTGYTSGAGTVADTDSILQAIQKLNGNDATNANLTGPVTSTGNATAIADGAIALAKLANGTDGEIPTWDSSGVITTVATGASGQVLTSNGAGSAPTFQSSTASSLSVNMTAWENITIGTPVGISNITASQVARANRIISTAAHGITTPLWAAQRNSNTCPIGGDKFIYTTYTSASSDTLFAQVGYVDKTTAATLVLGTVATVATAFIPGATALTTVGVCKLDTDKFVIFYLLDSSTTVIKYRVGTVSGTSISFGTEGTFTTALSALATSAAAGSLCAEYLSTDKGVVVYKCTTTADSRYVGFTVSGDTVTAGTPIVPGTNSQTAHQTALKTIGTDKFVCVTQVSSANLYGEVCTLSGTTITVGTEVKISATAFSLTYIGFQVISPTTDLFVVKASEIMVACTVSTRTITAGTTISGLTNNQDIGIWADSTSSFLLFFISASLGRITRYTISGTTITIDKIKAQVVVGGAFQYIQIGLDNGYCISADFTGATNITAWVMGMANNFIGIAQSTVTTGNTVSVLVGGIDANQSNLNPGGRYLVSEGALTFINSLITVDTLNDTDTVKAISTTQIVL